MVLAGHWPQTKALIIWGLRREQEVGRLPADNNQWEEGWNRTTRLQLGPGEVDGNTHTPVGLRSLTAPRSAYGLHWLHLRAYGFGSFDLFEFTLDMFRWLLWLHRCRSVTTKTNSYQKRQCLMCPGRKTKCAKICRYLLLSTKQHKLATWVLFLLPIHYSPRICKIIG